MARLVASRHARCHEAAPGQTPVHRRRAARLPSTARLAAGHSLGGGLPFALAGGWFGRSSVGLGRWLGFRLGIGLRVCCRLGLGSGCALALRLARSLPVLTVIRDVEASPLEDQPGTAGDLPGCRLATDRTLGLWLLAHLLKLFELVPLGALILIRRHSRPLS